MYPATLKKKKKKKRKLDYISFVTEIEIDIEIRSIS